MVLTFENGGTVVNIDEIAANETISVFFDAPWVAGAHQNTATATFTVLGTDYTREDPAHYYGVDIDLSIEKNVSVNGGASDGDYDPNDYVPADAATGPSLVNNAGLNPWFEYMFTNDGNVLRTDVTLSDVINQVGGVPTDDSNRGRSPKCGCA